MLAYLWRSIIFFKYFTKVKSNSGCGLSAMYSCLQAKTVTATTTLVWQNIFSDLGITTVVISSNKGLILTPGFYFLVITVLFQRQTLNKLHKEIPVLLTSSFKSYSMWASLKAGNEPIKQYRPLFKDSLTGCEDVRTQAQPPEAQTSKINKQF